MFSANLPVRSVRLFGRAAPYALLGRYDEAIAELEGAVDAGRRFGWRFYFDHYVPFEPLRDDPRFRRLRGIIEADMVQQLAILKRERAERDLPAN